MKLKIFVSIICLIWFSLTDVAIAQQRVNSRDFNNQRQSSSVSQFAHLIERQLQKESPLFYLLLVELDKYQSNQQENLQQKTEEEIQRMIQQSLPLQQRLIFEQ